MISSWTLVSRLLKTEGKPHVRLLGIGIVCMILVAITTAAMAQLMEPVINKIFVDRNASTLYSLMGAVFATFMIKSMASYGESMTLGIVGQKIVTSLQNKLYAHILTLPYQFFHDNPSGTLVSRFVNDVKLLEGTVTQTVSSLVKDALTVVALAGVMIYYDAKLALIALILFPLAMVPLAQLGRRMRKTAKYLQSTVGELTSLLTQSFQGIRLIKAYHIEVYESQRIRHVIADFLTRSLKGIRIKSLSHPIMELAGGIAIVVIIGYWGHKIIHSQESPGAFFAFITALLMMYEPAKRMAKLHTQLQESLAAATRIYQILDTPSETYVPALESEHPIAQKGLIFENVNFAYRDQDWVLQNINLHIAPHEYVAIVGPSGSGKTTLFHLMLHFFTHFQGRIFWNGRNLRDYSLEDLRAQIGLVSQDVTLFDDTIAANIAIGVEGLSQEIQDNDLHKAAQEAAAHDFIQELPSGYETSVGERGGRLSGGQKQRIALARALVRRAPLLLLDEATSALDSQSEAIVQKSLEQLKGRSTIVVIAHRLSTVQNADRIVLLDKGSIVAEGTHTELMKHSSLYKELCQHQFSKVS